MKKFILAALVGVLGMSVCSCSSKPAGEVLSFNEEFSTTAVEIVERINNMGEATLENEDVIEDIYIDYSRLADSEKAKVSNYDILDGARNDIAKLYNTEKKVGDRIDRSKILIGTYSFRYTGEDSVKLLADSGIDFIAGGSNNVEMLDLFEKYGLGAFVSAGSFGIPVWRGGDRPMGEVRTVPFTLDTFKEAVNASAEFDHPAMWGLELVDEPHSDDLVYVGEWETAYEEVHPDKLVYINLFPIYANETQLGKLTFEEHVQDYVDNVQTDYISFDFYDIDLIGYQSEGSEYNLLRHLTGLKVVADICRETGKDLWTVMQCGAYSNIPLDYITVGQLNTQLYTALAFGAKVINWACWTNGWFDDDTNMLDREGNLTPVYYRVQEVNNNIKALSPVYMKYTNTDACFVSDISKIRRRNLVKGRYDFVGKDDNVLDQDTFENIKVDIPSAKIFAGSFVKNSGDGAAMLFTNVTDFCDIEEYKDLNTLISFTLKDSNSKVVAYYPEYACRLEPDANGVYSFELENTDGVFITVEPIA